MTEPKPTEVTRPPVVNRLARRLLRPVFARVDALRSELIDARERLAEQAAAVEQLSAQVHRLEAYQQVTREGFRRDFAELVSQLPGADGDLTPAEALRRRLDEALLHAEVLVDAGRRDTEASLASLRGDLRLAQAMAEQAAAVAATGAPANRSAGAGGDRDASVPATAPPPHPSARTFRHPAPSFGTLYRAFEDRHRGSAEDIRARQAEDYLELLSGAPNPELPVVDLGCGRGELVELLAGNGVEALGVDENLGQVLDADPARFVQRDLFDWLDERDDASVRAVVALHVVEHLPLELQVRLVFEARRVLAAGGVLVLETPNALSLSTAATNFWVDPTHQRPVHPLFLVFLAEEAGFAEVGTRQLHPLPIGFRGADAAPELVEDLDSIVFGSGDLALVARR